MKRIVLIDADINLYQIAQKAEIDVDWGDGIHTLASDIDRAKEILDAEIAGIVKKVGADDYILCITGDNNFRKKHFPTYKANRKDRKPLGYAELRTYAMENHPYKRYDEMEADDVIGIMMTKVNPPDIQYIIHSDDKDLFTISGFIWDRKKGKVIMNSELDADRKLFTQILTGDVVDGYKGLPSCGKVKAEKILSKCETPEQMRDAVLEAFTKVYPETAKEEMLLQAQQARILRATDFDFITKTVKLWNPWEDYGNDEAGQEVSN